MLRMIWAQGRNGVIGAGNALPWYITEDSQRFRRLTSGAIVCMGRHTYESLPRQYRPLPGRQNWVLTRDATWHADGVHTISSLAQLPDGDVWIGGGAQLYADALPLADECWVTEIDAGFPGDTWAPVLGTKWIPDTDHPEASGWQASASAPVLFRYRILRRARS